MFLSHQQYPKRVINIGTTAETEKSLTNTPVRQIHDNSDGKPKVGIIDAMCEVQALKKKPTTTKMLDLKKNVCVRIKRKVDNNKYEEVRLLFDTYQLDSLKDSTRAKRAESASKDPQDSGGFDIHDDMSL